MKYLVGYQLLADKTFINEIIKYKEIIEEVYFSWDGIANGRGVGSNEIHRTKFEALNEKFDDLCFLKNNGINTNLLLNATCYGKDSLSREFYQKIGDTVDFLICNCGVTSVTTASPIIAKFIKSNFPTLEVRASVNMEIGTIEGMQYVSDSFDSFYLKREYNRQFDKILQAKSWCDDNGKKLYGLANSGCLNNCSAHFFHDNIVSHESEIVAMDNAFDFNGICHSFLSNENNRENYLRLTNFIRPEDVKLYEGLYDGLKLATRVNKAPLRVLNAYINQKYSGVITDILEPSHTALFYPNILENSLFPNDFGKHTMNCNKNCDECGYCKDVFSKACVSLEE